MQRNDSEGFISSSKSLNTIIGSRMTGGSSGGPWIVNFGGSSSLSGTAYGNEANRNVIVGTTSWGYTNTSIKQQGASPFTSTNIQSLVNDACSSYPDNC